MFDKDAIAQLHFWTHQSLDILLAHTATVDPEKLRQELTAFGFPTVWKQLMHILAVEEGWVSSLQDKPTLAWQEKDYPDMQALILGKQRVQAATHAYLASLSNAQLNVILEKRPKRWFGELKSPAFILQHVMTHTFHHKGQVVAMLRMLGHPAPDTDIQRSQG